jgi:hypothetical protein
MPDGGSIYAAASGAAFPTVVPRPKWAAVQHASRYEHLNVSAQRRARGESRNPYPLPPESLEARRAFTLTAGVQAGAGAQPKFLEFVPVLPKTYG